MKAKIPPILSLLAFAGGFLITPAFADQETVIDHIESAKENQPTKEFLLSMKAKLNKLYSCDRESDEFKTLNENLDSELQILEKKLVLSKEEEAVVSWILSSLANLYCPAINNSLHLSSEREFKIADDYKRREINLGLKLHQDKAYRGAKQRDLLLWYQNRGRIEEADKQRRLMWKSMSM